MTRQWLTPQSNSLEEFAPLALKTLARSALLVVLGLAISTLRWALTRPD
jgi:hypothetical protein